MAGVVITLLGQVSWVIGAIYILMMPAQEWEQSFTAAGALLTVLGMLLVGIAVLRTYAWTDWRRFASILVPAYYFLVVIPGQVIFFFPVTGQPNFYLLGTWYLTWVLVGYAMWAGGEQ